MSREFGLCQMAQRRRPPALNTPLQPMPARELPAAASIGPEAHLVEADNRFRAPALDNDIPINRALTLHDFDAAIEVLRILARKAVGLEIGPNARGVAAIAEALADLSLERCSVGDRIGAAPLTKIDPASGAPFGRR